ncbi:MAG: nitroreductase family deazaflavin-dependent oxidoreductase [Acidimicrobiia bacterium]|nr:nitroreductase family deazaflavin-dependent oxidoreductase [Acidimicrobiia bacterium]
MAKVRQSPLLRLGNRMVKPLIRWGAPIGSRHAPMALLTVPGRKTGISRVTPVALAPTDDGWRLIAVYGVCDWSRNLEAAGGGTVTIRGKDTNVSARRLQPGEEGRCSGTPSSRLHRWCEE